MIFIISLTDISLPLSAPEFVNPVSSIVRSRGLPCTILHYSSPAVWEIRRSPVILCGTALKDNQFREDIDQFAWIRDSGSPVLGICAGMQILTLLDGGSVVPCLEIGMQKISVTKTDPIFGDVREIYGYELHQSASVPKNFDPIGRSDLAIQMMRHQTRPWYGLLFHPEVRNEWVVEAFLRWCGSLQGLLQ